MAHKEQSAFSSPEDFIFSDSTGRPISSRLLYEALYRAMDEIGLQRQNRMHGFHAFRHSAGTILYEVTRDVKLVQKALRHSRMQTTVDIYVHPTDAVTR